MDVEVQFEIEYFEHYISTCETFQNAACQHVIDYNKTSFPNIFGHSKQEANFLLVLAAKMIEKSTVLCSPFSLIFACRILFPECRDGQMIYPCFETCEIVKAACLAELQRYYPEMHCTGLVRSLDPNDCFYEPIKCPSLTSPYFGKVETNGHNLFSTGQYFCHVGFELEGTPVRTCTYSGSWNGTTPICKPSVMFKVTISLSALSVFVILCVCICCKGKLRLYLFHNIPMARRRLGALHNQRNLFVTYSSQDSDQLNDDFLPRLKHELPRWNIQTYQQDFAPGRPLLDCIHEGVWESQAMLVLLTENYVASPMCRFEFTEAQTRSVLDKAFRLVVVIFVKNTAAEPDPN